MILHYREQKRNIMLLFFALRLYRVHHNVVHYDVSQAILKCAFFCTFYSDGFGFWACAEVFCLNRTSSCLFSNLCLWSQAFPKIDQDNIYTSFTRNICLFQRKATHQQPSVQAEALLYSTHSTGKHRLYRQV